MKSLTSLTNPTVKKIQSLHSSKGRKEYRQFIGEGLRICATLIDSPIKLDQLYTTAAMEDQAKELAPEHKLTLVSNAVMEKISGSTTPSGLLGVFAIPDNNPKAQLKAGIALAQIADPGNMGTLIRSAVAMGAGSIVIIEGADVWSPKVVQASAGAIAYAPIYSMSWKELVANKKNLILSALVVDGGVAPETLNDGNKRIVVVGNEANGIPHDWLQDCEEQVTLAMPGGTESLNAAIAGSIAMYLILGKKKVS